MIDQFNDNAEILQRIGAGSDFIVRLSLCAPGDAVTAARGEIYADYGEPYRFEWPAEGVTKAGDALVVAVDGHRLQRGRLRVRLEADMPDTAMPDGVRTIGYRGDLPAEICKDGDALGVEAEIPIPVVVATAYAIAAANGYGGTEAEYNAALTAMPGAVAAANEAAGLAGEAAELAAAAAIGARDSAQAANSAAASASEAAGAAERAAEAAGRAAADCWDSAADAAAAANAANAASEAANAAEALRATAESARDQAESQRAAAEQQRAQQAIANAEAAAAANAAALLAQQAAAEAPTPRVERIERDFAQYDELPPIQLVAAQTGKAVGASGAVENRAGYAVSELVRLRKGNTYLYRPANGQPIAAGVALCARYVREDTAALIDYAYAYNEDGSIATATAMHDPSLVYAYAYGEGGELLGISIGGERVAELPQYRIVEAGSYAPMFASLSDDMPRSGYYAILCNEDCEAAFSAPAPLGEALAVSYGVIRSLANQKEDKAVVKQLKERVAEIEQQYEALSDDEYAYWQAYINDHKGIVLRLKPGGEARVLLKSNFTPVAPSAEEIDKGMRAARSRADKTTIVAVFDDSLAALFAQGNYGYAALGNTYGSNMALYGEPLNGDNIIEVVAFSTGNGEVSPMWCYCKPNPQGSAMPKMNAYYPMWRTKEWKHLAHAFVGTDREAVDLSVLDLPLLENFIGATHTSPPFKYSKVRKLIMPRELPALTSLASAFSGAGNLEEIDWNGLDTGAAATMAYMFSGCSSLQSLDLSGWDTGAVTTMQHMFNGCSSLQSLDLSGWDTGAVTTMYAMFSGCSSLQSLDLSGWDTGAVASMQLMFNGCSSLRDIGLSPHFFRARYALPFSGTPSLGLASGNADSNGWLEMLAETAPTIRLAADWDEAAWQADKLEENPDTPKLLTEEGGQWFLNDGVGRTIQLHANLKNKAWAQPLIAQLVEKGYTVA